jgi:hypothetical protein
VLFVISPTNYFWALKALPYKLRDFAVVLELVDDTHAIICPVPDVAGRLSEFQKKTDLSYDEIINIAWALPKQERDSGIYY